MLTSVHSRTRIEVNWNDYLPDINEDSKQKEPILKRGENERYLMRQKVSVSPSIAGRMRMSVW